MAKATSAENCKLSSKFDEVRRALLMEKFRDRMEKPLAYWALPNDRRLPLAFLGRTIGDLLDTPFDELANTTGIGQKKISSLVTLLYRATQDDPPDLTFITEELAAPSQATAESSQSRSSAPAGAMPTVAPFTGPPSQFDPALVSEALWAQWRDTVRSNGLGNERLGRLAPTLQSLPTVIWTTPLSAYVNYSVSEIRQLKTHGEKRVRVVLEVFYLVHELVSSANQQGHLDVRLVPKFIDPIERWMVTAMKNPTEPSADDVRNELALPIIAQIETDAGPAVAQLAASRIGLHEPPKSVRTQSRQLGVTRARIYQLLDDCSKIMNVRWPEGDENLRSLAMWCESIGMSQEDLRLLGAVRELFYPDKYSNHNGNRSNGN